MSRKPRHDKCFFAPIPARAMLDPRLDGGRVRVLLAIGMHDRLGRGQGCTATSGRIASVARLNPSVVRRYIGDLIRWGYVTITPSKTVPSRRILRVTYLAEADQPVLSRLGVASRGNTPPDSAVTSDPVGCYQPSDETTENEGEIDPLIYRFENTAAAATAAPSHATPSPLASPGQERNSAEAAPRAEARAAVVQLPDPGIDNDARFLRLLEAWVRAFDPDEATEPLSAIRACRERCEALALAFDSHTGDGFGGWAFRLGCELSYLIETEDLDEDDDATTEEGAPIPETGWTAEYFRQVKAPISGATRGEGHVTAHRGPPIMAPERKRRGGGGWFGARGACEHWPAPERRALGLTQDQLAALSGCRRAYIATLEQGRRQPSPKVRTRLEEALSGKATHSKAGTTPAGGRVVALRRKPWRKPVMVDLGPPTPEDDALRLAAEPEHATR